MFDFVRGGGFSTDFLIAMDDIPLFANYLSHMYLADSRRLMYKYYADARDLVYVLHST